MRRREALTGLLAATTAFVPTAARGQEPDGLYAGIDTVVGEAMRLGAVPGMSVAVVGRGRSFARAWGVRRLGGDDPVTTRTAFEYGSTAKAFVALAAALLEQDGRIRFSDRIRDHLPEFEVADPYVSAHATIQDALSHATGAARCDFVWFGDPRASFATILGRMRHLPQRHSLRGGFEYSNLMYGVMGEIIARRAGEPLHAFLDRRVFDPIGARSMTMSRQRFNSLRDYATPHARTASGVAVMPRKTSAFGYEGDASPFVGSAEDGVRWLEFLLGVFSPAGLSRTVAARTWAPLTPIADKGGAIQSLLFEDSPFVNYGAGWFVSSYRGRRALTHLGGADGMPSLVSLLPDDGVGIVVLSNEGGDMTRQMLRNWVFDAGLGIEPAPQMTRYRVWLANVREPMVAAAAALSNAQPPGSAPPLPAQAIVGTYQSNLFGQARIRQTSEGLRMQINSRPIVALRGWSGSTYELVWELENYNWPQRTFLQFRLDTAERVTGFLLEGGNEQVEMTRIEA